ncbi:MAG: MBL fold metallo-hydrolase [Halobacteriota archaeon]
MTVQLLDGVYDITVKERNGRRFRVYLIDNDVPTLFDTGFDDTADHLISQLDDLGIAPERLIITHEDGDHSGAFRQLAEAYDLETWVPAADAQAIEDDSGIDADHEYGGGDTIGPYEAVHVPGHTPGCSVLVDEAASLAVTGDVVVGADWRGLPVGYLIPPPEAYSDDLIEAERNLDNLLGYEFDVALVSHGTAVMEDASEKLERFIEFPGRPDR